MSDRYMGRIKCPECNGETEYIYNDEWGTIQVCDECKKEFRMFIELKAVKIN